MGPVPLGRNARRAPPLWGFEAAPARRIQAIAQTKLAVLMEVLLFLRVRFCKRSDAQGHTKGREVAPLTPVLKPDDYVWHPEVGPRVRWSFW